MTDTTARVLQLLGLLQHRSLWSGEELAERLGVTTRSVRRDVERLRDLGYPVRASAGVGGGYQLGAGGTMPPLLLDPDEAVAVTLSLRLAAGGAVTGVEEPALRALAKLDQVLPTRLRGEVEALAESVISVDGGGVPVDAALLTTLARACRDRVLLDLGYRSRQGTSTQRRVEPYHLVSMGRRWYLLAFDLQRLDWRTFRIDRIASNTLHPTTLRFTRRRCPDPVEHVREAVLRSPYRYLARLRLHAPMDEVLDRVPQNAGVLTDLGDRTCELETGAESLDYLIIESLWLGVPFEVIDPPELAEHLGRVRDRLRQP
ncbi:helix-turn-helix transcriptional regulator [Ornithinimicrobium sp. Y1694]|uniref:helix-turn-helix transcriptional regulator n=1 Tax=Ornithinimicrobium sp. Y1694 TaxID=3418590 RepID=UPI003CEAA9D5